MRSVQRPYGDRPTAGAPASKTNAVAIGVALFICSLASGAGHAETPPPAPAAPPSGSSAPAASPGIERTKWGEVEGKAVELFTLTNQKGLIAKVTNYGAILVALELPDRKGHLDDVVLGYDNLADYLKKTPYFGATVGRVANRIANAEFELEGKTYQLSANDGHNHLHGGKKGWDKVVWVAEPSMSPHGPSVKLHYVSKDGEEGYPGTVEATATYTLTKDNELTIEMTATTDRTTIINMAHHSYFNLSPGLTDDIREHLLTLQATKYTPGMPPDGKTVPVAGTPFDFRKPKAIGKDLQAAGAPGPGAPVGYDSNWIVDGAPNKMRRVARIEDPRSGRVMTIDANQPGAQFYSGGFLDSSTKGKGRTHVQYGGFCLETQKFPNAINVPAWKSQFVLKPGRTYKHSMIYRFTTSK